MINLEESKKRNYERKALIYFPTDLSHIRDHNGWRPGSLHVLVAPKGGSKSTLFRTWVSETVFHGKRTYVRLSEEKTLDFQDDLVEQLGRTMDVDGIENLKIDSELDLKYDQAGSQYFEDLKIRLKTFKAEILFIDNFTTSEMSDCNVQVQSKNAKLLRDIAIDLNIPVIVASHTAKGFKSNSIATGDDVRGTMMLVNTAPFVYSINVFFDRPGKPSILFVDKARGHKNNKWYYQLTYNEKVSLYVGDRHLSVIELAMMIEKQKGSQ